MSTDTLTRPPRTSPAAERLAALRAELARQGIDGFVIPISDEHMSEYVGSYAQRLEWLTGFKGSAGSAAVRFRPRLQRRRGTCRLPVG